MTAGTFSLIRKQRKMFCLLTAILFFSTQCGILPVRAGEFFPPEALRLSPGFQLSLPSDLGTIQAITTGSGPTLVHLQTAHGNYQAQKKIQAILHYLKDQYGFRTLLLEGSPFELEPAMIRFFPDDPKLTQDVADGLARKALLNGAELFLIEEKSVKAFGIEDLDAYKRNVEKFRAVLLQKKQTEQFLADMEMQIDRLTSPYLNKNLKDFLRRLDEFESGRVLFQDWMLSLRQKAEQVLELDLRDPALQIDRPMLLRYFTLRALETRLDLQGYQTEKENFLKAVRGLPPEFFSEIKRFLDLPLGENQLSDPQTGLLFERMISLLPSDFNYHAYPNVELFIGHLILQSELKGKRLFKEMDGLQGKICAALAVTSEEKELLALFKDYRLLKKLFALELVPEDYKTVLERADSLRPGTMVRRFLEVNRSGRVREAVFGHEEQLGLLFETALEFYAGTQERDVKMMEKIEAELKATGTDKAVIITGGFHAQPFKEHFQNRGFNYALIAPKITNMEGKDAYVDYMLHSALPASTLESIFQALSYRKIQAAGFDPMRFTAAFIAETAKVRKWPSTQALVHRLNDTSQLAQFQPDYGAMNLRLTHNRHGVARLRMFFEKNTAEKEKKATARSEMRVNGGFSYQDGLSSYEIPKREFGDLLAFLKSSNLLASNAAFDFNTFLEFAQGLFEQKPIGEKISADLDSKIGRDGESLAAYFVRVPEQARTLFGVSGLNFIFDRKSRALEGVQVFPAAERFGPSYLDISKLRASRENKKVRREPAAPDSQLAHFIRGLYAGEESVYLTSKSYRVGEGEWQVLETEHAASARELFKNHPGLNVLKVDPGLSKSGLERAMEKAFKAESAENDQFLIRLMGETLAKIDPKSPAGEIAAYLQAQGLLKNGTLRILEIGPSVVAVRTQYQVIIAKAALKDLESLADAYASDLRAKLTILLEGRSSEKPKFADLNPLRDFPLGGGTKGHIRVVYYLDQSDGRVYVLAVSEKRSENELKDHRALHDLAEKIKKASGKGSLLFDGSFLGQIETAENEQVTAFLKERIGLVLSEPTPNLLSPSEELPGSSGTDFMSSVTHALAQQGVPKEKAEEAALGIEDLWQTFERIAQNVGQSPEALGTTLIQLLAASAAGTPTRSKTPAITTPSGKTHELEQPKTASARATRPEAKKKNYSFVPGSGFLPEEYQQWLNGEVSNPPEFALRVSMAQLEEPAYELLEQSSGGESRRIAMTLSGLKYFGHDELYLTPFYDSDTNSYGFQVYSPKNRVFGDEVMMQGYEMRRPAADVEEQENLIRVVMLRKQGKFSERAEELAPGAMTARSDEDETEAPGLGKKRGPRKGDLPEMKGDYFEKIAALVFHAVSGGKSIYHASLSRDPLMTGYSHPDFIWKRMIFDAKLGADIDDIGQTIVKYTLVRDAHPELFDPDKPITLVVLNKTATENFERNGYVSGRDFRFITLEEFMAENGFAPDAKIDGFTQAEVLARLQKLRVNDYSERDLALEIENMGHRIKSAKVPQGKAMTKAYRRADLARLVHADPEKLLQYLRAASQRVAGHFQKARYINKHYENLTQSLAEIQSAMPDRERIERELKDHEKVYEDIRTELSRMAGLLKRILPKNLYASGTKAPRRSRPKAVPNMITETTIPPSTTSPAFETPAVMVPLLEEPVEEPEIAANSVVLDEHEATDRPAASAQIVEEESGGITDVELTLVNPQEPPFSVPTVFVSELRPQAPKQEPLMVSELSGDSLFDRHLADGDPGLQNLMAEMELIYADHYPGLETLNPLLFDSSSRSARLYVEVLRPQPLPWWDVDASEQRVRDFLNRDFSGTDPAEALVNFLKSVPNPHLEGEVLVAVLGLDSRKLRIQEPMKRLLENLVDQESDISKRLREESFNRMPKRIYYFLISLTHQAIARYSSNPQIREWGWASGTLYNRMFAFQSAFGHREWDFVSDPDFFWEAFTAYFILGRREAAEAVLYYLKIKVRDLETAGQPKNLDFLTLIARMEGLLSEKIEGSALSRDQVKDLISQLEGFRAAKSSLLKNIFENIKTLKTELKLAIGSDPRMIHRFTENMDFDQEQVMVNQILESLFGPDARVGRTKTHHTLVQTDFYSALLDQMEQFPELSASISSVLVPADSPKNLMVTFPFFDDMMSRPSDGTKEVDEIDYVSSGFATGMRRVVEQSLKNPEVHRKFLLMVASYHSLYQDGRGKQWAAYMATLFLELIKQGSLDGSKTEDFLKNVQRSLWVEDPREAQAASQILTIFFDGARSIRNHSSAPIHAFYEDLWRDIFTGFEAHPDKRHRTVMFPFFHKAGLEGQRAMRDQARIMTTRAGADSEAVGKMTSVIEDIVRVSPQEGLRQMFEGDIIRPLLIPHFRDAAHKIQNLILSYEGEPAVREGIRLALERFSAMARVSAEDPFLFDAAQKHALEILDFPEVSEAAPLEAVLKQWKIAPFVSKMSEVGLKRDEEKSPEDFLYALLDLSIQKKLYEDAMESNGLTKPRWDAIAAQHRIGRFLSGLNVEVELTEIAQAFRLLINESPNPTLDFSMMDYFLQGKGAVIEEGVLRKLNEANLQEVLGAEVTEMMEASFLESVPQGVILNSAAAQEDPSLKFYLEMQSTDNHRVRFWNQIESLGHGEWDSIQDAALFEGSFRGYLFTGKRKEALEIFHYLKIRRFQALRKGIVFGAGFETAFGEMQKLLDLTVDSSDWETQFSEETKIKQAVKSALDVVQTTPTVNSLPPELPEEAMASAAGAVIFLDDLQGRLQKSTGHLALEFVRSLFAASLDHPDKVFMIFGTVAQSEENPSRGVGILAAAQSMIELGDKTAFWDLMKRIIQASPDIYQLNNFAESFAAALAKNLKTKGLGYETDEQILLEIQEGFWSDDAFRADASFKMVEIWGSGKELPDVARTLLALAYYRHFRDKPEDRSKIEATFRHYTAWYYFDYPDAFFESVLRESLQTYNAEPTIEKAKSVEADLQAFYASETLPDYEETAETKKDSPRKMFAKKVLGEFHRRVASEQFQGLTQAVLNNASFTDITPNLNFLKVFGLENGRMTKKLQQLARRQDDLLDRLFLELVSQNGEGLAEADRLVEALKLEVTAPAGEPLLKMLDKILLYAEKYPQEIPYLLRALRKIQSQLPERAKQKLKKGLIPILEHQSGYESDVLMELSLDIQDILGDGVSLEVQVSAIEPLVFNQTDPLEFLEVLGSRLEALAPSERVTVWVFPGLQTEKDDWKALGFVPLLDMRTELSSRMGSVDHFEIQNTDSQRFKVVLTEPIAIPGQSVLLTELRFAASTDLIHVSPRFDSLLKANSKTLKPKELRDLQERVIKFWSEGKILLENALPVPYGLTKIIDREQFLRFAKDIQNGENPVFAKIVAEDEVERTQKEQQSSQTEIFELAQRRILKKVARGLAAEVEKGRQDLLDRIEKREADLVPAAKLEAGPRHVLEERIASLSARSFAQELNPSGKALEILLQEARQKLQSMVAELNAEFERLPLETIVSSAPEPTLPAPKIADRREPSMAARLPGLKTRDHGMIGQLADKHSVANDEIVEPLNDPILGQLILNFYLFQRLHVPEEHMKRVRLAYEILNIEVKAVFKRGLNGQYADSYRTIIARLDQIEAQGGYFYQDILELGQMTHQLENGIGAMVQRGDPKQSKITRLQAASSAAVDTLNQIIYQYAFTLIRVDDNRLGKNSYTIIGFQENSGKIYLGIPRLPGIYANMEDPADEVDLNGPGPKVNAQNLHTAFPETLRPILIPTTPMDTANPNDIYLMRRPRLAPEPLDFESRLDPLLGSEIAPGIFVLEKGVMAAVMQVLGMARLFKGGEFKQFLAVLKREAPDIYEQLDRSPAMEKALNALFEAPNSLAWDAGAISLENFRVIARLAFGPAASDLAPADRNFFAGTLGDLSRVYGSEIIGELLESPSARKQYITRPSERTRFEAMLPEVLQRWNAWLPVMRSNFEKRFGKLGYKSRLDPALGVELAPGVQIFETLVLDALAEALGFPDAISMRTSPLNLSQFEIFKTFLAKHAPEIYDAMDRSEEGRKQFNLVVDRKIRVHFRKAGVHAVNLDQVLRSALATGLGQLSEDDQRFFIRVLRYVEIGGGEINQILDSPALRRDSVKPGDRERFERLVGIINETFEDYYPVMVENYERRYGSFESRIPDSLGFEILPGVVVFRPEVIKAFLGFSGASKIEDLKFEPFKAETYARFLGFLQAAPALENAARTLGHEKFNQIFASNLLSLSQTDVPPRLADKRKLVLNAAINTLTHSEYMFFVQMLAATRNSETEDVYRLVESNENISKVVPESEVPRFQYIAAQVARSSRRFDRVFDPNYEKLPLKRSEVRFGSSAASLTLEPQTRTAVETYREHLLPLRFENYGTAELVRVLKEILSRTVYSEKDGFEKPRPESILRRELGEGRLVPTPAGTDWIRSMASDGRVLLDSAWITKLTRKSPRALYLLLTSLEKFQGERGIREPLLAVTGEESLLKDIAYALQRADSGLNGEEKAEVRHFLDSERLKSVVRIVSTDDISNYIQDQDFGVATLSASQRSWLGAFPLGAQFLLEPNDVAEEDLEAIAFLIPSLLKAAQLVRGITDPKLQKAELLRHLGQILPGVHAQAGSNGFAIQFGVYIQKELLNRRLVSISA